MRRHARVRLIAFDELYQAHSVVFELASLRRREAFCRVQTCPASDIRRTRFGTDHVELLIFGPIFWAAGDRTVLELEPYGSDRQLPRTHQSHRHPSKGLRTCRRREVIAAWELVSGDTNGGMGRGGMSTPAMAVARDQPRPEVMRDTRFGAA